MAADGSALDLLERDEPPTKYRPVPRGKQRDSFVLSEPGRATGHIWEGAVRSGKTIVSIIRFLVFLVSGPPGNVAMIGRTERTLKRNVLDVMVALLGPKRCKVTVGSGEAQILGRTVYLAGANNIEAVAKIQGMTLVAFYGDEAPTWPAEVFNMARTRCSEPGAEWFVTGNPASSTHHLNTDWILRAKLHLQRDGSVIRRRGTDAQDVHVYSFTIYDNPYLTAKFVRTLETSYVGMFYRRYVLGEWCLAEGAIYDDWNPDLHVITAAQLPEMERWLSVGVDHGVTNPFAALAFGIGDSLTTQGKALYATAEYRYDPRKANRKLTDREYSSKLRLWLPTVAEHMPAAEPEAFVVDPAAAGFRNQLFRDGQPTRGANNDVLGGIATMASLISAPGRFFVADRCKGWIEECPSYSWDDKAALAGDDKPVKTADHSLDGGRYGVHTTRASWWYDLFPDEVDEDLVTLH